MSSFLHDESPHLGVDGNDMNPYCADVAEVVAALGLKSAIHVGHSTGGYLLAGPHPAAVAVGS